MDFWMNCWAALASSRNSAICWSFFRVIEGYPWLVLGFLAISESAGVIADRLLKHLSGRDQLHQGLPFAIGSVFHLVFAQEAAGLLQRLGSFGQVIERVTNWFILHGRGHLGVEMVGGIVEIRLGIGEFFAVLRLQVLLLGRLLDMLMRLPDDVLLAIDEGGKLVETLVSLAIFAAGHFEDVLAEGTDLEGNRLRKRRSPHFRRWLSHNRSSHPNPTGSVRRDKGWVDRPHNGVRQAVAIHGALLRRRLRRRPTRLFAGADWRPLQSGAGPRPPW